MTTPNLIQEKELVFARLTVPVWRRIGPDGIPYSFLVVRDQDLPEDLRTAFTNSQIGAQIPMRDGSYLHDFVNFMNRRGKGWGTDCSAIVNLYMD